MDKNTIEKLKRGDNAAFERMYKETYSKVYYLARNMVRNDELAEDISQQVYIKVWQKIDQFDENTNFEAWLSSITRTTSIDELRKRQLVLFNQGTDDEGNEFSELDFVEDKNIANQPEMSMDSKESSRLLQEIIDGLSEEQRVCVMMFYYQDMSVRDIAKELGTSENTVKSRLNYGRNKIKDRVQDMEKKGTKLYSFAPVAFFLYLLRGQLTKAAAAEMSAELLAAVGASSNTTTASGANPANIAKGVNSALRAGSGKAAKTVAKTAAWTWGKTIVAIISGLLMAGTVTVAAILIPRNGNSSGPSPTKKPHVTSSATPGADDEPEPTEAADITPEATEIPTPTQSAVKKPEDIYTYTIDAKDEITITGLKDTSITELDIPSELAGKPVRYIDRRAFAQTAITRVAVPKSVILIKSGAFSGCQELVEVNLPSKLMEIEDSIFYGCTKLESIVLPEYLMAIPYDCFKNCTSLKNVSMGKKLVRVEGYAFEKCTALKEIVLPENVTFVGEGVFKGCTSLETIYLPKYINSFSIFAFEDCTSLENVYVIQDSWVDQYCRTRGYMKKELKYY